MIRSLQVFALDNGLTLVFAPNPHGSVVAVQVWISAGSADETPKKTGIAHFLEHMLFKGTATRGVGQIAREIETCGGEINAWTSFNQTVFHVVMASRYLDSALDVLADTVQNPAFDPDEFELEREVILEEIHQSYDDPSRNVAQALFASAFLRHPYRRPVIGAESSVRSLNRGDLIDFFQRFYVPNNMALVIVGDFDPVQTTRQVKAQFGGMRKRPLNRRKHHEPAQSAPRTTVQSQGVVEAQVNFGFHIPSLRSPDIGILDVAAVVLGQGDSSRLTSRIQRDKELVTSVYAYAHAMRDDGLLIIPASAQATHLSKAIENIATETYRLTAEDLEHDEIEKAKRAILADTVYQRETAEGLARKLGFYQAVAGDVRFEAEYLSQIREVTASDVRAAAARYLTLENTTLSVLVPSTTPTREEKINQQAKKTLVRAHQRLSRRRVQPVAARTRGDFVRETLPNGLRVLVKRDPSVPVVALRAVWLGGVRHETADNNGIHRLMAATFTRGFAGHDAETLVSKIDSMAGTLSGVSGRNSLGLRSEWLADNWEQGLDLLTECILQPSFGGRDFDREKRRTLEDLAVRQQTPGSIAMRAFCRALYKKHPYRLDTLGTRTSVRNISRRKVVQLYQSTFPLSDLTLALVGDVEPGRAIELVGERLGQGPRKSVSKRKIPQENFFSRSLADRTTESFADRQQSYLILGFPGTTVDDPDRYPLEVLSTILGSHGGRLFVQLRERGGLAYRVGAFALEGIDPGYIATYVSCHPSKLLIASEAIRRELERVSSEAVDKAELDATKAYLIGSHEISLQRRAATASTIAFHEAYGLGYDHYTRYVSLIQRVSKADVLRVAKQYFDWDLAVSATVNPRKKRSGKHARD